MARGRRTPKTDTSAIELAMAAGISSADKERAVAAWKAAAPGDAKGWIDATKDEEPT